MVSYLLDFSNILDFYTLTFTCQIWQDLLDPAKFCQKCLSVGNSNIQDIISEFEKKRNFNSAITIELKQT